MDMISQIIIGISILVIMITMYIVIMDIEYEKEEKRRCPDCGHIPLKFDARFAASRAESDVQFMKIGWVRCSCGEIMPRGYDIVHKDAATHEDG